LTYPAAEQLRKVIEKFPLDKIMLETDAPFLAPQTKR
jgi:TatD DNase family protein